jgi:hypothetical protein
MEWRLSWNTEKKSSRAFLREIAGVPAIIHTLAVADGGHVAGKPKGGALAVVTEPLELHPYSGIETGQANFPLDQALLITRKNPKTVVMPLHPLLSRVLSKHGRLGA